MKIKFYPIRILLPLLALTVSAAMVLQSCRSSRNTTTGAESFIQDSEWTTLYTSLNANISRPMSLNCSGRATLENGKYIHLSMRFIGMEVAAMYMDADSVFFVDKYHKYYFAEPLATVLGEKYKHLTIGDIQKIFLGKLSIPETERTQIKATDFVETPAGEVASSLSVFADTDQGIIKGNTSWNPTSAKWNEPDRKATFKTPGDNYKRITPQNLKTMLKSMSF